MVTAILCPRTRISSGSSAARMSDLLSARLPEVMRMIFARRVWAGFITSGNFFNCDPRVVIRHAAAFVHHAATDDRVAFRPMNLQVAGRNWSKKNPAFVTPDVVHQRHAVIVHQMQIGGVVSI